MWSIIALLTLLAVEGQNWVSGGDQTNQANIESRTIAVTRSASLGPIRVAFDASALTGSLLTAVNDVTANVDNYLKNTVNILNIAAPWSSNAFICGTKTFNEFAYEKHDFYVIFDLNSDSNFVDFTGRSETCHLESSAKSNPLGGVVYLNPSFATLDKYRRWTYVLHEVIHLLAFSEVLASKWEYVSQNRKYTPAELTTSRPVRGTIKRFLKTPKVLETIRFAFNNPNLDGVELEEFSDLGRNMNANKISHWDARVMHNDIMVIRSISEMIISTVSLAVLEDSGWYTVNYKHSQVPIVGRGEGCKFTVERCILNKYSNSRKIWCAAGIMNACDTFGLNKGSCNLNSECSITNSAMNYFSSTKIGGRDVFEDFCPYVETTTDGSCRSPKSGNSDEIYGETSRCFENTLTLTSTETRSLTQKTSCWQVKCDTETGSYIVTMKRGTQNVDITCLDAGGLVYYTETLGGRFHSGWIKCPSRSVVCGDAPCTAVCLGNGYCQVSTCMCFDGFSGSSCETKCSDIEKNCNKCDKAGCCLICGDGAYLDNCKCIPCSSNCRTCDLNECTECNPNYKKVLDPDTGKYICEPICDIGCPKCLSPGKCIIPDGKCLDSEGVQANCCGSCDKCSFVKCCECLVCKTGFFLTSINTCTKECAVNCKTCATIYNCAECKAGFILNSDKKCQKCPTGCSKCDDVCPATCVDQGKTLTCDSLDCFGTCEACSSVLCTECESGYVMNEITKECVRRCPENCKACTTPTTCDTCNLRFYLDGDTYICKPCEAGCVACIPGKTSEYTICTDCASGYFIVYNNPVYPLDADCLNCMPGCTSCSKLVSCKTCGHGWYLDNTETCRQCEYGCRSCDGYCCKTTYSGFYISICKVYRCNKACSTCDVDQICNTCIPGYFFHQCTSTNCLCRYCEPNCSRCSGPIECVVCKSGYYLEGVNDCVLCQSNCYNCYAADKCYHCRGGYYLDEAKQCQPCSEGCCHCVTGNNCLSCAAGWWPNELVCQMCPTNCSLCWSAADCYACKTGWYLYDCPGCPDYKGGVCKKCLTNCVRCLEEYMCTLCTRGYFVSSGVCEVCGPYCSYCVSSDFCTICNMGWYLTDDKTCEKCKEGCQDCFDEWTCLKAKTGWYLINKDILAGTEGAPLNLIEVTAVKCSSDCSRCTGFGGCTTCNSGFYIDTGFCTKCPEKCTSCDDNITCKSCASLYFLNSGACEACVNYCNKCDITGCLIPKSGYYIAIDQNLSKKIPLDCQSPCGQCVGIETYDCITCRLGFGLEDSPDPLVKTKKCSPCPINCYSCDSAAKCKVANSGFYVWTDGSVYQCSSNCQSCAADTSFATPASTCMTCNVGYGVNSKVCDKCPSSCSKCSIGKCDSCISNYFINSAFGCSICDKNCELCFRESFNCIKCYKGTYLSNGSGSPCVKCIPNCLTCNSGDSCLTCAAGYVFTSEPACVKCMTGCAKCQAVDSCDVSLPGYYLDVETSPFTSLSCAAAKGANCKTCSKRSKDGVFFVECFTCNNKKIPPNCA